MRLEACRERAASWLQVRPPSLQHWARKRQRIDDNSDDDDDGTLIAKARSRADQRRCARQQVQISACASRAVAPSSEAGLSSEAGAGPSSETGQLSEAVPSSPSQPGVEAEQTCPICMDFCDGEPRGRPDPQEHMRGWGYTPCC